MFDFKELAGVLTYLFIFSPSPLHLASFKNSNLKVKYLSCLVRIGVCLPRCPCSAGVAFLKSIITEVDYANTV